MTNNKKKSKRSSYIWIFLFSFSFIIGIVSVYGFYLYQSTMNKKENEFKETKAYVLDNDFLVEISKMEAFYEQHSYHIFLGQNKEQEEVIVFVPVPLEEEEIKVISARDIISEQQAIIKISKECSKCKKISVKPAMINDRPLWELTYFDAYNRYNIDYLTMEDGERYERLQLNQTFK